MFEVDATPAAEIEQLEIQIEELREAVQRSRRLGMVGAVCAIVGPIVLACLALGALYFTPARMIVGISLALGGIVLTGSSKTSTEQLERSLKRTEDARNSAIDALDFVQIAGDAPPPAGARQGASRLEK
jgi:Kef-type K+ transport system membrane component KefB